ncbi:unnamed protein product [Timema podura]|uniref:Uncharacterized protein n=1 Tax=Timema podura TaxID=61482 RepID=A0ABN7PA60_TIMPD|nr:unnamed protein product [Timema podura]
MVYPGSGVNILLITPEKAIKLTANDFFRHHLAPSSGGKLPLPREMLAGGLAGLCQIIITTPMELLKIQLQDAGRVAAVGTEGNILTSFTKIRQFKSKTFVSGVKVAPKTSATAITLELLRTKGILGLYKGIGATMLRDVSFSVIYFPLFARLNALGPRRKDNSGEYIHTWEAVFWCSLLSGCTSGAITALLVNPFDVVKTRLQLLKRAEGEIAYTSIADAFMYANYRNTPCFKIWKNEGVKAFFKGGACRMIVIAPLFGIAQMVYYLGVAEMLLGVKKS